MKRIAAIAIVAALAYCCSRPPSYEPFMLREAAEYGDTYTFLLDLDDSSATYSLDFYTRLDRPAFGEFPSDSIILDLRWFSPSDSILVDTTFINVSHPVGEAYYSKDFISPYGDCLDLPETGEWRLKAKVVNDCPEIRGIGVIFKRK
ncbi:MAG: hypothetical protein IK076_06335 [Bacteroidales bacterium]|nr:hypothetical protein [Bacteroidales bacterium]